MGNPGKQLRRQLWQEGACRYCGVTSKELVERYETDGKPSRKARLTLDHVQPRSKGGSNGPENIVLACYDCNQRKADLEPS